MRSSRLGPVRETVSRRTVLEPRWVGEIQGRFVVPQYQRGYRWGPVDVRRLLEDIHESSGETMSHHAFLFWACFDIEPDEGGRLVDQMLRVRPWTAGERAFMHAMRRTRMRLYEIEAVEPGASVTVREVFGAGAAIKVRERSASRELRRGELVASRLMRPGASGQPELDGGFFRYSELQRAHVLSAVETELRLMRRDEPELSGDDRWRELAPILHEQWRTPRMPALVSHDGRPVVLTRVRFDVRDARAVEAALDAEGSLEREDAEPTRWRWNGVGASRSEPVILGWIELKAGGEQLEIVTNSRERGERGRALVESLAGDAVTYCVSVHQDPERAAFEALRTGEELPDPNADLDPRVQEQLRDHAEQYMAEHQVRWVDEEVPALDGATPRGAARDAKLRPKLVELLEQFDRLYESALAQGQPAADPSWIRDELDVPDRRRPRRDPSRPPPLAHERMAELVPGLVELARAVATRVREAPDYSPARSIERVELLDDLGFQRFVRDPRREDVAADADPRTASTEPELLASHAELMCNLELHHRKVFWVGEGLSWMLGATRLDVPGELLRLPFGCFAVAFTDRYALGLAERMLARHPSARIRGHLLEVVTAYVTRTGDEGIRIALACDMLDPDWPYLVVRQLIVRPGDRLDAVVDSHFPDEARGDDEVPAIFRCTPLRELLRLVLNAILYTTSADAERAPLEPAKPRAHSKGASQPLTSETVFHLPGTIDIGTLRELKRSVYGSTDRQQVQRCMVRGHWRRAAKTYEDPSPRWIEPHWRGPSVAAVVERQYRLQPGE